MMSMIREFAPYTGVLTLFIPLIIRAIALKEMPLRDW